MEEATEVLVCNEEDKTVIIHRNIGVREWGTQMKGEGQINEAVGVAMSEEEVLVCD